jgi:hypothetical protein
LITENLVNDETINELKDSTDVLIPAQDNDLITPVQNYNNEKENTLEIFNEIWDYICTYELTTECEPYFSTLKDKKLNHKFKNLRRTKITVYFFTKNNN